MSGTSNISAAAQVAAAIASDVSGSRSAKNWPTRWRWGVASIRPADSVSSMMRTIAVTASTGYPPTAVSADNITASVPSSTAFATSEASARVGRGFPTIDSSICVAVITGHPNWLAWRITRFWARGTSSNGSSTPRSPRATMMLSVPAMMPSRSSSAVALSIFETIRISGGISPRRSSTSRRCLTNDNPTKSARCSRAKSMSARSFGVTAAALTCTPGRFIPLWLRSSPP